MLYVVDFAVSQFAIYIHPCGYVAGNELWPFVM